MTVFVLIREDQNGTATSTRPLRACSTTSTSLANKRRSSAEAHASRASSVERRRQLGWRLAGVARTVEEHAVS